MFDVPKTLKKRPLFPKKTNLTTRRPGRTRRSHFGEFFRPSFTSNNISRGRGNRSKIPLLPWVRYSVGRRSVKRRGGVKISKNRINLNTIRRKYKNKSIKSRNNSWKTKHFKQLRRNRIRIIKNIPVQYKKPTILFKRSSIIFKKQFFNKNN